jgi:hypothetical protein
MLHVAMQERAASSICDWNNMNVERIVGISLKPAGEAGASDGWMGLFPIIWRAAIKSK